MQVQIEKGVALHLLVLEQEEQSVEKVKQEKERFYQQCLISHSHGLSQRHQNPYKKAPE